jgi:hypothetical protein
MQHMESEICSNDAAKTIRRKKEMQMSEAINDLAGALCKAQSAIKGAVKNTENAFLKTKYADLSSVIDAIRQPFADNGLSYVQSCDGTLDSVIVQTTILHSSGQWMTCGELSMPVLKPDAQSRMSALTYCRRGSLSAATGVAPEDDDGAGAGTDSSTGMPDVNRKAMVAEIAAAPDLKTLQRAYTAAVRVAQEVGDKVDLDVLIKAKDKRKGELGA